jgi:hypothetical protein
MDFSDHERGMMAYHYAFRGVREVPAELMARQLEVCSRPTSKVFEEFRRHI